MSAKKINPQPVAWRYVGPGYFPGVPQHDLSQAEFDALPILDQHNVRDSAAYEVANTLDPLGELADAAYDSLTPSEKGARTRKANELREEAERLAQEEAKRIAEEEAAEVAAQEAGNNGQEGES